MTGAGQADAAAAVTPAGRAAAPAGIPLALVDAVVEALVSHADELTALDRPIGDGDHGINMRRGAEAIGAERLQIAAKPFGDGLVHVGTLLVMKVGGASGPLFGTLFIELGRRLPERPACRTALAEGLDAAVAAVARRGRAEAGQKTMLDVLAAVAEGLGRGDGTAAIAGRAEAAARATIAMRAMRGRASFLGERSIGHMDPGARSCALVVAALCGAIAETPLGEGA